MCTKNFSDFEKEKLQILSWGSVNPQLQSLLYTVLLDPTNSYSISDYYHYNSPLYGMLYLKVPLAIFYLCLLQKIHKNKLNTILCDIKIFALF